MLASYENGTGDFDNFMVFSDKFKPEQPLKDENMWEVLIVDDEQDVHKMTKMVLRNYSFLGQKINFHSAYSAREAKEFLRSHQNIALVLLDVVMEERNAGLKLVEFIRQDLENESIRIIIRTGQPGEAPEETVIRDYIINDYIEKGDITTRRLYTTITTSLRGYRNLIALQDSIYELERLSSSLRTAYTRLEALDKEKAKIIQFLYHELLTPLNHVGASQVFDVSELSEQNRAILEMVKKGFNRLNALIKAFLDYFEFMGSNLNLKPEPIIIEDHISRIIEDLKPNADRKKLIMDSDLSQQVSITADPNLFDVVLQIIVDNAINHSEEKGRILIKTQTTAEGAVQLLIEDNGTGIPKKNLERVFQAYDLENYYRREGGFGLNLSKSRYIIESHGGKLWAESDGLDKGARFIIEL
ncbi:hybrid sensor histidine kinase/response regulator [bacterium]|nr:hybrid sensor histidine kinase/response regulator [bacterium]